MSVSSSCATCDKPPGGGSEVFAQETVDEKVGRAVDAHQQVAGVDDELDIDIPIGTLEEEGDGGHYIVVVNLPGINIVTKDR